MNPSYVIRDLITNKYYWKYRLDYGLTSEFLSANIFTSKEDAFKEILEISEQVSENMYYWEIVEFY